MTFILQNHHAYTNCAKSHPYYWEESPGHSLAFTRHPVMKMDSTSPVNAKLPTEVVIRNAGVWTEMEARLKDWQSVVSIQNNTDQTFVRNFLFELLQKLVGLGFNLLFTLL